MKEVNVVELKKEIELGLKDSILIDVREDFEYVGGHATSAKNYPISKFDKGKIEELKTFKKVFMICRSGGRSKIATDFLSKNGVYAVNVQGGTGGWINGGFNIER